MFTTNAPRWMSGSTKAKIFNQRKKCSGRQPQIIKENLEN